VRKEILEILTYISAIAPQIRLAEKYWVLHLLVAL